MVTAGAIVFIVVWSAFFVGRDYQVPLFYNSDAAKYLVDARNLVDGKGLEDPAPPYKATLQKTPTAFPMLLMVYWALLHPHLLPVKLILTILLVAGTLMSYLILKQLVHPVAALLGTLAFCATDLYVFMGSSVLSETVFIPVLYTGLYCLYKYDREKLERYAWFSLWCFVIAGRIRVVGIPFFIVCVAGFLIRKDWRKAFAGVAVMAVWLLFEQMRIPADVVPRTYLSRLHYLFAGMSGESPVFFTVARKFLENAVSFAGTIYVNTLFPFFYSFFAMNVFKRLMTSGLCCYGMYGLWLLWKRVPWTRVFLGGMVLMMVPVLCWPNTGTIYRYLFPFIPVLFAGLLMPVQTHVASDKWRTAIVLAISLAVVVNQSVVTLRSDAAARRAADNRHFKDIHDFIRSDPVVPDLIISPFNLYTYLQTDIHSVTPPLEPEACRAMIAAKHIWMIAKDGGELPLPHLPCSPYEFSTGYRKLYGSGGWALYTVAIKQPAAE